MYEVSLVNFSGAIFDYNNKFTSLTKAKKWASGRGYTHEFGKPHKYDVIIYKTNGDFVARYKTA